MAIKQELKGYSYNYFHNLHFFTRKIEQILHFFTGKFGVKLHFFTGNYLNTIKNVDFVRKIV